MKNIMEEVRKFLRTYPPLAEGKLHVDFLPEEAQSYSVEAVLAVQRSTRGSCVCRSGSRGLHHYIKQEKIIICILRGLRKKSTILCKTTYLIERFT